MRIGLDTNILVYAEGVDAADMASVAMELIERFPPDQVIVPAQALAELYRVLRKKGGLSGAAAERQVLMWIDDHVIEETTSQRFLSAMTLATTHGLNIFDAIILATAADSGCRLLLSEDMHDGFSWAGCTVCNPFASNLHPILQTALGKSVG
jgi:predicted nucleic acid-binding protein